MTIVREMKKGDGEAMHINTIATKLMGGPGNAGINAPTIPMKLSKIAIIKRISTTGITETSH